jgi:hypothetical protein
MNALHRVSKKGLKTTGMLGKRVSEFSLAATGGTQFAHRGTRLVLYFHHKFPFELLSDPDEAVCKQFEVMKLKNMYGKKVRGIERSTFVLGPDGVLAREWRGVKVPGHAQEVLNFAKAL